MYFPVLRGKRFELAALRDYSESFADSNCFVPIIEPVKSGGLAIALNELADNGAPFAFLVNPRLGEFVEKQRTLELNFIEEYLDEYDNYHPAMYVDSMTTSRNTSDFAARYDVPVLYFLVDAPTDRVVQSMVDAQPKYVAIHQIRVPQAVAQTLAAAGIELIRITDPFQRQIRNSDYPLRQFFSDAHLNVDETFAHFGDYSIVGDNYSEGGGAAYTVALHHVVAAAGSDALEICHYKSDFSESTADVAGKFLEALTRLVEDQGGGDPRNQTEALEIYSQLLKDEHFPGLGFAKKLGLLQHFEVICRLISR